MIERNEARLTTGYEIVFPAASIDRVSFGSNMIIAVGICINDGDQGAGQHGQKGWSGWGPHSAVYGKTPSETGRVTLDMTRPPAACDATTLQCVGADVSGAANVPVNVPIFGGGAGNSAESGGTSVTIGADTGTSGLSVWTPDAGFARAIIDGTVTLAPSDVSMTFDAYQMTPLQDGLFMDWDCIPFMAQMPFFIGNHADNNVKIFEEYSGAL